MIANIPAQGADTNVKTDTDSKRKPEKNGGTSRFLSKLIGVQLAGFDVEYASLRQKSTHADIVRHLANIDAGCDKEFITEFISLPETQNSKKLSMLAAHQKGLLDGIHTDEQKIFCFDYFVNKLQSE